MADLPCVAVAPINWRAVAANVTGSGESRLLEDMLRSARDSAGAGSAGESAVVRDYAAMDPAMRRAHLVDLVQRELSFVLGTSGPAAQIPHEESFTSLGLDSLTSVELRNRLQSRTGKSMTATSIFDWPTVADLASYLDSLYVIGECRDAPATDDREEFVL